MNEINYQQELIDALKHTREIQQKHYEDMKSFAHQALKAAFDLVAPHQMPIGPLTEEELNIVSDEGEP